MFITAFITDLFLHNPWSMHYSIENESKHKAFIKESSQKVCKGLMGFPLADLLSFNQICWKPFCVFKIILELSSLRQMDTGTKAERHKFESHLSSVWYKIQLICPRWGRMLDSETQTCTGLLAVTHPFSLFLNQEYSHHIPLSKKQLWKHLKGASQRLFLLRACE